MAEEKHYKYFANIQCEYYPCHKIKEGEQFNCLFCYCPLYLMPDCKGNYVILSNGVKDCSHCLIPHKNYDYIVNTLSEYIKDTMPSQIHLSLDAHTIDASIDIMNEVYQYNHRKPKF